MFTYLTAKHLISNDQTSCSVDGPLATLLSHCYRSGEGRVVKVVRQRTREMSGYLVQSRKHVTVNAGGRSWKMFGYRSPNRRKLH